MYNHLFFVSLNGCSAVYLQFALSSHNKSLLSFPYFLCFSHGPTYLHDWNLTIAFSPGRVQSSDFSFYLSVGFELCSCSCFIFLLLSPSSVFIKLYLLNLVNLMPNKCLVKSNPMVWLVGCNLTTRIYGMQRGPRSGRITLYIKSCGSRFSSTNQVLSYAPDPHISGHVVQPDCVRSLVEVHSAAMLTIGPVVLCCWRVSFTWAHEQCIAPLLHCQGLDLNLHIFWRN